jgi:lysophospholipase L1-like esterase
MDLRPRTWRQIAALSLAINLALVLVFASRHLRGERPVRASREQARAALLDDLARTGAHRRDVVALGDSLTERAEWWELLDRPVANRGIANDTIAGVRARLDSIVALAPRVVFLLIGVNDLLAGTSPEALAPRHTALVAELRRRLPDARIVALALLPIRDELVASDEPLTTATVRRANELCRPGAIAAGAEWLDLTPDLADATGELDARYSSDGLHLSVAGYRTWARALLRYLP